MRVERLERRVLLSITVTSTRDAATDGSLTTLIGAILTADGTSGGDTINLSANSTFTLAQSGYAAPLTGNGAVTTGITLLPGINQPITINGNGSTITLGSGVGRFFSVNSNLVLNNVNLVGGVQQGGGGGSGGGGGGGGGAGLGGAIFVNGTTASLTMNNASVASSSASGGSGGNFLSYTSGPNSGGLQGVGGAGGGGLGGGGASGGNTGNTNPSGGGGGPLSAATGPSGADGIGGSGGTGGNPGTAGAAGGFGGGGGGGGSANATIGASSGGNGGAGGFGGGGGASGFRTAGGNGGFGGGGGATLPGGGQGSAGAGGAFAGGGESDGSFAGGGGGAGLGGAIFNDQGAVNLNNVSLVGNSAKGGGGYGGGAGSGGAVFNYSGTVTLRNATLANNSSVAGAGSFGGANGTADGGAIYNYKAAAGAAPTLSLFNSALVNNSTTASGSTPVAADVFNGSGGTATVNGNNHNYIAASSGTISGGTVLTGTAFLDFPGSFGGYVMVPPEAGSPLLAAGDPATSLATDETGATRSTTAPTLGAYEGALPSPFPLADGTVLVTDSTLGALFAVNPTTGDRQAISAANVIGTGLAFLSPTAVTVDGSGNAYVAAAVTGSTAKQIVKVDLTTGNRTLLSGNGVGAGTAFTRISSLAFNAATATLYATDSSAKAVYTVNLSTGDRTLLSNNTTPNATNVFVNPNSVISNGTTGTVVADRGFNTTTTDSGLLTIAGSGARGVLSDDTHPDTVNQIVKVQGIAYDTDGSILAIDSRSGSNPPVLDRVATTGTAGARSQIATFSGTGSTGLVVTPTGVAANSGGIYVTQVGTLAADNQVLQVSGGTATKLAGNDVHAGPYFGKLSIGIALVPSATPVAPTVSTAPANTTVNYQGSTTLTAAAAGNPAPTAQWQLSTDGGTTFTNVTNGGVYGGATTNTLTITGAVTAMNGYLYQVVYTNSAGNVTTPAATLTVDYAAAITGSPSAQTVNAGGNTTFSASAIGRPAPTVQWQVSTDGTNFADVTDGGVYSGSTTGTLTITGATAGMNGNQYRAVYSNTLNGASSASTAMTAAASLTVNFAPAISGNPSNATINAGGNASFTSSATGGPAPTGQWQVSTDGVNFTNITDGGVYGGATTGTLTITGAVAAMNGNQYREVFTNGNGSTNSNASTLTVDYAAAVAQNPSNATITTGGNATFTAAATGNPTPTVQWQVSTDGVNFTNVANGGVYSGATTNTLTITGATSGLDGSEYRAVYSNTLQGASSASTAMTTTATLAVHFAPTVSTSPTSATVNAGGNASFQSAASGSPAPSGQWQVSTDGGVTFTNITNGGVYSGATTGTLAITGATAAMNGYQYHEVFTNGGGTVTSNASTLTVDFAAAVTGNPSNSTIGTGGNATFTAAATGNPTPSVQWQVSTDGVNFTNVTNGGVYGGATTNALTITGATSGMDGSQYRAVYSNTLFGTGTPSTAMTTAATLAVHFVPTVSTNPTSATVNAGGNASFQSAAAGSPAPTGQWQVSADGGVTFTNITDGGVYSGASTGTLTITGALAAMNGYQYHEVFTNGNGSATSTPSTLSVDFAAAVTANPSNSAIGTGGNASFTAAAAGNPTPTVQWQVSTDGGTTFNNLADGGIYSGSTTTTLTVTGATLTQDGYQYQAVFSNTLPGAGSPSTATTTAATLAVSGSPVVGVNPSSATINAGGNGSFQATVSGSPTPTAQWQLSTDGGATFTNITDGGVYSGAATGTLTITGAVAAMNGYQYHVVYTNTSGTATSTAAALTVDFAPAIAASPTAQSINTGGNATFTAAANGRPTPAVQWQVSTDGGINFTNITNGGVYGGATSNTLTITGATSGMDGYQYHAVYSNTLNGAGSPSTATTPAAALAVHFAPTISGNPSSTTINAGSNTTFTSSATGSPAPAGQWQVSTDGGVTFTNVTDGGVYGGATTGTLSITGATADMNGNQYREVFTNGNGTANSNASTLTVDFAPSVTTQPSDSTVSDGGNASFTAAGTGNPTPTVQWQVSTDGGATFTDIAADGIYGGATTGTLTVTGASLAQNGFEYRAVFSNTLLNAGSPSTATTTVGTLTITSAPVIGLNPANATINAGDNTTFQSSATGSPAPAGQWQVSTDGGATFTNVVDGGVYSGATTGTLTITGATADMNGNQYREFFTNGSGTATTTASTLTVDSAPVITTNPANSAIGNGGNTTFTVAAAGNPAPTIQWQVSSDGGVTFTNVTDGGVYSGSATTTLTLTGASSFMNGSQYRAVFTNTLLGASAPSTATTTAATLSVGAPVITVNAFARLVSSTADTGTLHVQAVQDGSDASLTYTWSIASQPNVVESGHTVSAQPLAIFSLNGTNAAKNTSVTFLAPGDYVFNVAASNGTQSATSQVSVTSTVKPARINPSSPSTGTQNTRVSGVEAVGDGQAVTGFVVSFTAPLDPTSAQNVAGYRILKQAGGRKKIHIISSWFGTDPGDSTTTKPYAIASAAYDANTNSVTLTLAAPMPVANGMRLVKVLGTGPNAVLDANGQPVDGDANGTAGGQFSYRLQVSVGPSVTYRNASGDKVQLSLSGPGQIVTLLPSSTKVPVIDTVGTDPNTSVLTGTVRKGRKGKGVTVLDKINGTATANIQLGSDFSVNQTGETDAL